jgi:hypothetical protein
MDSLPTARRTIRYECACAHDPLFVPISVIGTFRTWRNVPVKSVARSKADVRRLRLRHLFRGMPNVLLFVLCD